MGGPRPSLIRHWALDLYVIACDCRLLFWTDCGHVPKIERSSLSGTDRQVIVNSRITRPISICVDLQLDRLLWTDSVDGTVESVDLLGNNRQHHIQLNDAQFFGITVQQVRHDVIKHASNSALLLSAAREAHINFKNVRACEQKSFASWRCFLLKNRRIAPHNFIKIMD